MDFHQPAEEERIRLALANSSIKSVTIVATPIDVKYRLDTDSKKSATGTPTTIPDRKKKARSLDPSLADIFHHLQFPGGPEDPHRANLCQAQTPMASHRSFIE